MPKLVGAPEQNGDEAELNDDQCSDLERIKEIIKLRIYENWSTESLKKKFSMSDLQLERTWKYVRKIIGMSKD